MTFTEPDEAPQVVVRILSAGHVVEEREFSSLEAAESFADEATEQLEGATAEFEDRSHHVIDEVVSEDTALAEDYPHAGPGPEPD